MTEGQEAEAEARVGRVLNDKYTLERLLGTGGMGAVYLARHRNGARVAVKILHSTLARNPAVRERFLREAYAANKVEHHGVVTVLDDDTVRGGEDDGAAYLVMELLEGESLDDRAARSPPVDEQEILRVFDAVLDVLDAAHAKGVVHRDLKPDNIFLARDPDDPTRVKVKVLDFGLARLAEAAGNTQFGLALGTPSYMAPEQAAGRHDEIDGRTDLFALGATGFRILASRRIHEEENLVMLVAKMATEPAPPIRSVAPNVSPGVAAIIDRALAFERADRYPSAAEMRADVQALRTASVGPQVVVGSRSGRTAAAAAVEPTMQISESDLVTEPLPLRAQPESSPPPSQAPARGRSSGVWLLALIAAAVAFVAYRATTEPDPFAFLRDLGVPIPSASVAVEAGPPVVPLTTAAAPPVMTPEAATSSAPESSEPPASEMDASIADASAGTDEDAAIDAAPERASSDAAVAPLVAPSSTLAPLPSLRPAGSTTAPPPAPPPKHSTHPPTKKPPTAPPHPTHKKK